MGSLASLTNFWMQEVSKCAKPNCIKAILANKSDFFMSNYNRDSIVLPEIDSDDEMDDQSIDFKGDPR
jgi:hypothetical protein